MICVRLLTVILSQLDLILQKKIRSKSDADCLKHFIPENSELCFDTVDKGYVLNAINRLEKGKSSGPDKVTITLVKDAAISIAYPLKLIYNASLTKGIFPDIWKLARVTPKFKSSLKTDMNNHRPISVISVFLLAYVSGNYKSRDSLHGL